MRWDSAWAQRAYYVHTRRSWRLLVLLGAIVFAMIMGAVVGVIKAVEAHNASPFSCTVSGPTGLGVGQWV